MRVYLQSPDGWIADIHVKGGSPEVLDDLVSRAVAMICAATSHLTAGKV